MNPAFAPILVFALWLIVTLLTALKPTPQHSVRARHRAPGRHRQAPQGPGHNYLMRQPARFPAPPKGWAER
jgi:hypothetical protein